MSRYDHVGCRTDLFWIEPEKVTRTKSSVHQGPKGHRKVQKDANAAQNRQRGRCYQTKAMSTAPLTRTNGNGGDSHQSKTSKRKHATRNNQDQPREKPKQQPRQKAPTSQQPRESNHHTQDHKEHHRGYRGTTHNIHAEDQAEETTQK